MPGNPAISPSRIRPYTNRWKFHTVTHDGRFIPGGTWTDAIQFVTQDGRQVISRTVAKTSAGEFKFWMSPDAPYVVKLVVTGPRGGQEIFEMD